MEKYIFENQDLIQEGSVDTQSATDQRTIKHNLKTNKFDILIKHQKRCWISDYTTQVRNIQFKEIQQHESDNMALA